MFAKFAGYTQEYLLFDSNLYIKNQGIRLDHLFSLQNSDSLQQQVEFNNESKDFSNYIQENETLYVANSAIPGTYFSTISALSASLEDGTFVNQIFSEDVYSVITDSSSTILSGLSTYFTPSYKQNFTTEGTVTGKREKFMNSFDYDITMIYWITGRLSLFRTLKKVLQQVSTHYLRSNKQWLSKHILVTLWAIMGLI
jgi:hypothetical protein